MSLKKKAIKKNTEVSKTKICFNTSKNITKMNKIKKPETFIEAVEFFDLLQNNHSYQPIWSIQYYGFGEHFTCWSGFGTFTDFNINLNTTIDWKKMKEIIIESAKYIYEELEEHYLHWLKNIDDSKLFNKYFKKDN